MINLKDKIKRIGFKIGMAAMTFFPAKSAAQDFIVDTTTNTASLRLKMIPENAIVNNTSSEHAKEIAFYDNARRGMATVTDRITGAEQTKIVSKRDFITIHDGYQPKSIETKDGPKYPLIGAAVRQIDTNTYEFNTDELFEKYRKLLISVFPQVMRNKYPELLYIEVTFSGPFELVVAHYDGTIIASMCRNAYTEQLLEKSTSDGIRLFRDLETNEYVVRNNGVNRTYTATEALKRDNSQTIIFDIPGNTR